MSEKVNEKESEKGEVGEKEERRYGPVRSAAAACEVARFSCRFEVLRKREVRRLRCRFKEFEEKERGAVQFDERHAVTAVDSTSQALIDLSLLRKQRWRR